MSDKRLCTKKFVETSEVADISQRVFYETKNALDRQKIILCYLPDEFSNEKNEILDRANAILYMQENVNEYMNIISGKYRLKTESVDLLKFLNNICEVTAPFAERNDITFDYRLRKNNIFVNADYTKLVYCFCGLLKNAIDYAGENGKVTVRIKQTSKFAKIVLKNTGDGMIDEVLKHCKEPFFSRSGKNSLGLGLTLASNFAKSSKGSLAITSTPKEFTQVILALPIDKELSIADDTGDDLKSTILEYAKLFFGSNI